MRLLRVAPDADAADVWRDLGAPALDGLIMLSGGAGKMSAAARQKLTSLFQNVAGLAAEMRCGFIDGGTATGVMSLLGQAMTAQQAAGPLIGVAPEALVTYPGKREQDNTALVPVEPNHSHLVLVEQADWGDEIGVMYGLAALLAKRVPSLTLLADGGPLALPEIQRSVQLGLPVVIAEGSGRLADYLAGARHQPQQESEEINALLTQGRFFTCPLDANAQSVRDLLFPLLSSTNRFRAYTELGNRSENL